MTVITNFTLISHQIDTWMVVKNSYWFLYFRNLILVKATSNEFWLNVLHCYPIAYNKQCNSYSLISTYLYNTRGDCSHEWVNQYLLTYLRQIILVIIHNNCWIILRNNLVVIYYSNNCKCFQMIIKQTSHSTLSNGFCMSNKLIHRYWPHELVCNHLIHRNMFKNYLLLCSHIS